MSSRPSPLPNRVTPEGEIIAHKARGGMMGNRGGRIHQGWEITRRQASRRWIVCVTEFRGRHREVMKTGYTELFFLDEATAFAAGHRPCFECRRKDAKTFAKCFGAARADDIDAILSRERLKPREVAPGELPDGAMVRRDGRCFLVWRGALLPWAPDGYGPPERLSDAAALLTPPATVAALRAGYRVAAHPSAGVAG